MYMYVYNTCKCTHVQVRVYCITCFNCIHVHVGHCSIFSPQMRDAVTTAPRPISDASLYDIPRGNQPATLPPMDNGLYSVPRSIPVEDAPPALFSVQGMQFYTTGNPFDLYDVPRPTSMSPDEEGIYDDPFDIIDMEIYDYPPDVGDLGLQDSGLDSARNSMLTTATDFTTPDRASSAYSDDSWKTMSLPPLPNSARPSMVFSVASSDELIQVQSCCMYMYNVHHSAVVYTVHVHVRVSESTVVLSM